MFSEPPSDSYTKFSYGNDNIFKHRNVLQEQLASWATKNKCTRASINELLSILKNHGHKDLPIDSRTLLKSPRYVESLYLSGGKYLYLGIYNGVSRLLNLYKGNGKDLNPISLVVNIDGLPLFQSSSTQLWPILCSFSGLSPFFVAVYCGTHKPDPVSDFINDFLEEYSGLSEVGLNFHGHLFQVKLKYFCFDAPVRAMLKSIKPHNGYNSSERCIVEGEYKENRVVFNDIGCALRSDQDFSQGKYQPLHQLGKSVFVDYGFPCVSGFVLDSMHLVMLGVVRCILLFLKEGPRICKLSQLQLNEISKNLEYLNGKLPSEFARQPRSLNELNHWKATEFKQFILYTGPVVLKGVVSNEVYTHFLAFSIAK